MQRLLILGGTREAGELAEHCAADPRLDVITSLAGRTRRPAALPGTVRSGGFGGVDGLIDYLRECAIDRVIDASHPFAIQISEHAAQACAALGIPRLQLWRSPWPRYSGDRWIEVASVAAAAAALSGLAERVMLTTGHKAIESFSGLADCYFVVRLVEPPLRPLPLARYELVLGRGPFREQQELALLQRCRATVLITKNSGGTAVYGKIAAARRLRLPVIMIRRPLPPAGARVSRVADALAWLAGE